MTAEEIDTRIFWVHKGAKIAVEFANPCNGKKDDLFFTKPESNAVFSKYTPRSLKNKFYRYMEDCEKKSRVD